MVHKSVAKKEVHIFVLFINVADAALAQEALHRRWFGGRIVTAQFYSPSLFLQGVLTQVD